MNTTNKLQNSALRAALISIATLFVAKFLVTLHLPGFDAATLNTTAAQFAEVAVGALFAAASFFWSWVQHKTSAEREQLLAVLPAGTFTPQGLTALVATNAAPMSWWDRLLQARRVFSIAAELIAPAVEEALAHPEWSDADRRNYAESYVIKQISVRYPQYAFLATLVVPIVSNAIRQALANSKKKAA
jgi:hypothetical protein